VVDTDKDVTEQFDFDSSSIDGESLPILKCICGKKFDYWYFSISIYRENAYACPECGRRFYFVNEIKIYEVSNE
jgi:hypothetical protein